MVVTADKLVQALKQQHPGVVVQQMLQQDALLVRVPGIEPFTISALETLQQHNDDQVVEIALGRIQQRTRK
jgi:hypothetical protein